MSVGAMLYGIAFFVIQRPKDTGSLSPFRLKAINLWGFGGLVPRYEGSTCEGERVVTEGMLTLADGGKIKDITEVK